MPPTRTFAITADDRPVKLDSRGCGEVTITVSNSGARPIRGRARLIPAGSTKGEWLAIDGEKERNFSGNEAHQFVVRMTLPPGTAGGKYSFRLNMMSVTNPDDDFTEGPTVSFESSEVPRPVAKASVPWLLYLILGLVVVGGGVAVWALWPKKEEPVVQVPPPEVKPEPPQPLPPPPQPQTDPPRSRQLETALRATNYVPVTRMAPAIAFFGLPAPTPLSPRDGAVFSTFPRNTVVSWNPVPRARSYGIEIEFSNSDATQWSPLTTQAGLTGTSFSFNFVGAQPGRWRVWGIDSNNSAGAKSAWQNFKYTL